MLEALAEVAEPVVVRKLAVRAMPTSGTPDELLRAAGIDAASIADSAHEIVSRRHGAG